MSTTLPPWPPVCRRCKREAHGWPLERGDRCSPQDWYQCIRDPDTVARENERHAQKIRALANRAHVRKTWRKREHGYARAVKTELAKILTGA